MDINSALLSIVGLFYLVLAAIFGGISYYLGRRKTETPVLAGIVGALLTILPPLALVYIAVLIFKSDIQPRNA